MRFDRVIELVALTHTQDAIGQETEVPVARTVYANEFTVSSAEFYDAGRNGLKPERQYQIRACEYQDEALARVDDIEYQIIRTERRGEWVRLTCQRKVGNVADTVS